MKLPSTPDVDYNPLIFDGISNVEHDDGRTIHQYFKQQQHRQPPQHPSVIAAVAADISTDNRYKYIVL